MKITLISWDNLGYISLVEEEMKRQGHSVNHIRMNDLCYVYPDFRSKVQNAFSKTFFNYNIKREKLSERVENELNKLEYQDLILVVSSDWLSEAIISKFKKKANKVFAWFYDAAANYPRIPKLIPHFERAFTFEPDDAEKFRIEFLPNFNPYNEIVQKRAKKKYLYHVSSERKGRKELLMKIAQQLKSAGIDYDIHMISKKVETNDLITVQKETIPLSSVHQKLKNASFQIDIQRDRQKGVSFRIFEAMGLQQKVFTTNKDVMNYDFYDPENILVINRKNCEIPESFLLNAYKPLPPDIYRKYTLETWVKNIIYHG